MNRCLDLAKKGLSSTRPNPMVGCVIAHNNVIIGEGFTSPYGGPHAEVNAIRQVKQQALLKDACLYVSLEPCSHHGRTPPCTDLIIKSGIKKIFIGCQDPFEKVNGKGINLLKEAGCEVLVGIMEEECNWINRRFFTFHKRKRPYIILKWAETKDGFIDRFRAESDDIKPNWISNKQARQMVHQWRVEEQAILVGTNTVFNDNPRLDVRSWNGKSPLRLILDKTLKLPKASNVFDGRLKSIVFTAEKEAANGLVEYVTLDFSKNVPTQICDYLYQSKIQSVIIEGGGLTLQGFIDEGLWDEARIFKGTAVFKDGIKSPRIKGEQQQHKKIMENTLRLIVNKHD